MSIGTMENGKYKEQLGGGVSAALLARIAALETKVTALESTHGDSQSYGTVKLSNATDVTNSAGLAVPTSELNVAIENTLANKMENLKSELYNISGMVIGTSLSEYVKKNIKNRKYMVFGFANVTDNPFQTINGGYVIAFYDTRMTRAARLLATDGGAVECGSILIS